MKLTVSFRVFLVGLSLFFVFFFFRGVQFAQSITSFLRKHFWEVIF